MNSSRATSFFFRGIILLWVILVSSCDDSDFDDIDSKQENPLGLNKYYDVISSLYYWQEFIPEYRDLDLESNATPAELMNEVKRFSPNTVDRWSFAVPLQDWNNAIGGRAGDFGLGLRFHSDSDLRVAYSLLNSGSYISGLKRGTQILQINGTKAIYDNSDKLINYLMNDNVLRLKYIHTNTTDTVYAEINRIEYISDPVLYSEVFSDSDQEIGYINLFSFNNNLDQSLTLALDSFERTNIDKLIVDIRYNRGGLLNVMKYFADKLICGQNEPIAFYKTIHNEEYEDFNTTTYLSGSNSNQCISDVVFITTDATASASEVLINAMRPIIRTKVVGTRTHGKLMGSHVVELDDYALSPISFRIVNNVGEHDDFAGLNPDEIIKDDVQHNWGVNEKCISVSIALLLGKNLSISGKNNRTKIGNEDFQFKLIDSPGFLSGSFD